MKRIIFVPLLLLILVGSVFTQNFRLNGKVTEVIDPSVVVFQSNQNRLTVKFAYIILPGDGHPLYSLISDHVKRGVIDKPAMLEIIGIDGDKIIGRIFINGIDIGLQFIRDGAADYADSGSSALSKTESDIYISYRNLARQEKRGIWENGLALEGAALSIDPSPPTPNVATPLTNRVTIQQSPSVDINSYLDNIRRLREATPTPVVPTSNTPRSRNTSTRSTGGPVNVKGYYRKNGTYVRPHTRRAPRR